MGVKSTIYISRAQAIENAVTLHAKVYTSIRAKYQLMCDVELEDELEQLNDIANGGEGFENYIIEGYSNDV